MYILIINSSYFYSSSTAEDVKLTEVTDSNRVSIAQVINNLNPNGGTCLGDGIMKGMDVSQNLA